jgi:hypothetical protein
VRRGRREVWLLVAVAAAVVLVWRLVDVGADSSGEETSGQVRAPATPPAVAAEPATDHGSPAPPPSPTVTIGPTRRFPTLQPESAVAQPAPVRPIVVWGSLSDSSGDPVTIDDNRRGRSLVLGSRGARPEFAYSPRAGEYRAEGLTAGICNVRADIPGYHSGRGRLSFSRTISINGSTSCSRISGARGIPAAARANRDRSSNPGTDPEPDYQAQVDGVWGWELVRPIVTKDPPPESLPSDSGQDIEDTVARRLDTFIENSDPHRSIEESVFEIHGQLPVYASAMIGDRVMRTEPVDSCRER